MPAVMILAAGLGTRLRPFTQYRPKCLYPIQGMPLLGYHLQKLAAAGFCQVVINVAYLADQVRAYAGDGSRWGLNILYSQESPDELLGTGGAVKPALCHWPSDTSLLLISADIYSDLDYKHLLDYICCPDSAKKSRLLVVKPPYWVGQPDFYWDHISGQLSLTPTESLMPVTFSGVGCFPLVAWHDITHRQFGLDRVVARLIAEQALYGQYHQGLWHNVGSGERVVDLYKELM